MSVPEAEVLEEILSVRYWPFSEPGVANLSVLYCEIRPTELRYQQP